MLYASKDSKVKGIGRGIKSFEALWRLQSGDISDDHSSDSEHCAATPTEMKTSGKNASNEIDR